MDKETCATIIENFFDSITPVPEYTIFDDENYKENFVTYFNPEKKMCYIEANLPKLIENASTNSIESLQLVCAHEYGHYLTFPTLSMDDISFYMKCASMFHFVASKLEDLIDDYEHPRLYKEIKYFYYQLPLERIANEAVHISEDDLIRTQFNSLRVKDKFSKKFSLESLLYINPYEVEEDMKNKKEFVLNFINDIYYRNKFINEF